MKDGVAGATCESDGCGCIRSDDMIGSEGPRIALLTPYSGNNLGDAAIQDSIISNLRARLPRATFSGITLSNNNFVERHGKDAFPLSGTNRPFHGMSSERSSVRVQVAEAAGGQQRKELGKANAIRQRLKQVPLLGSCLKRLHSCFECISDEFRHCVQGYRFLRGYDLLIVSGGGQLDEEWGGPWGLPFALFKWAILGRVARVPCAIVSVGAGKVDSAISRVFLSFALRVAQYRSYRDQNTKIIATGLLERAARDSVVPDLAFSLPHQDFPDPCGIRSVANERTIIALSPIAFAKPESWPQANSELYKRYLDQMARLISQLLKRDAFLVMVWSALSDRKVIDDILERLDPCSKAKLEQQLCIPAISSWSELLAVLLDVDFLVASRLHSAILGFQAGRPTVAISFDPKVDWVMNDLRQTNYVLQICNFVAEDVVDALERLEFHKQSIKNEINAYRQRVAPDSSAQFDTLARIAAASFESKVGGVVPLPTR
ncbi:MAG TPA: polysaccharide pyruvyl transferase family protein [Terracidiphilus sp.]|nr:polysaccharide pyruvyl transferase family protein [Terracidiphilus sp.]